MGPVSRDPTLFLGDIAVFFPVLIMLTRNFFG